MIDEIKSRIEALSNGEVPLGYSKIKVGIRPIEWKVWELNKCLNRIRKPVQVDLNEQYRQIGIRSHGKGLFYKKPVSGVDLGNKSVFWIEPECFIVNIVFAWEMAIGKTTQREVGMIASHRFPMYKPKDNKICIDYLTYYFKSPRGKYFLELASPGGAGRNKTLGQTEFFKLKLPFPLLQEQIKIVKVLSTWDNAIELKEKLIEEKKKQKIGLMQRLLTGEVRLPGFDGEWEKTKLGDVTKYRSSSISMSKLDSYKGDTNFPVYSAKGIFKYVDFYDMDIEYVAIVKDGAGAGRISKGEKYSSVIATMGYIVGNSCINLEYLYQNLIVLNFRNYIKGSTIPHVYYNDYKSETINLPCIDEQSAIAIVLSHSDREITLLEKELEKLKLQKKGLMQLLLTGIVRVNIQE